MGSRRQERVSRVVREVVSDAITNHLSDPRIEGLVTVTNVDMSPDLRQGIVYISILGTDEKSQARTLDALVSGRKYIQMLLGRKLAMKFCPMLYFRLDQKFKKTLETMNLIDEVAREYEENEIKEEELDDLYREGEDLNEE